MYHREIIAKGNSQVTLICDGKSQTVNLYSPEGLGMIASLWLKLCCEYRVMYEPTWLGVPVIQLPTDIVMMQELIWKLRPDVIVECGVAHGGSVVLYASLCELLGKGRVIGIDVEVRQDNRMAIQNHPMSKRIEIIERNSVDPSAVALVKERVQGAQTVLIILDSNHSYDHVLQELNFYHALVTPGSYLVAMDGAQAHVWDVPRGNPEWKEDHPLKAIHKFLSKHPEFQIDSHYTRMHVTSCPDGFLRKLTPDELKQR